MPKCYVFFWWFFFRVISINLNTYNSVNLLYNFPTNYGYFCEFQYGKFPHIKTADYSMLVGFFLLFFFYSVINCLLKFLKLKHNYIDTPYFSNCATLKSHHYKRQLFKIKSLLIWLPSIVIIWFINGTSCDKQLEEAVRVLRAFSA